MTSTEHRPVVLIAIDWYLPAFKAGGPIRSIANLVAALGDEFDFRIVCGNRDLGSPEDLDVKPNQWIPVGQSKVRYLTEAQWTKETWTALFHEIQPARLYLNSLYSGPFSRLPWKVARSSGMPTTLAPRGMLGPGALAIKPLRKKAWLTLQQWTRSYGAVTWHASTDQEADEIRRWFPRGEVRIALNLPVPLDPQPAPAREGQEVVLLSVGRIHPIKNYLHGVHTANALAQKGYRVKYRLVGPVEDALEAERLRRAAQGIDIEFIGPIPPTRMRAHFGAAHLILVPSLNENFGHSVAEAIASARPVIVSDQTVWSTMNPGRTVACLPLELDLWLDAAQTLLDMDHEDIVRESTNTYHRCLLDERHIAAQRQLFTS